MRKLIRPALIGAASMAFLFAVHGVDVTRTASAQTMGSGQGNQADSAVPGQRMPMGPGMGSGMGMGPGMMGLGMMQGQGMPGMMGQGMMHPGMMGPGMMGQGMMHPGMMGQGMLHPGMRGPGMMGPGMMGQGMMHLGMIYGMPGRYEQEIAPEQVREMLQRRLDWHGNPRLKLGEIKPTENGEILADIVTREGSLVQRLAIDRRTGALRQVD